jgi:hypothetical protein
MEAYKIRPPESACALCKRPFASGQEIVSTIREEAEQFVRVDACAACPVEGEAFCRFRTRAPVREVPQKTIREQVIEFFKKLAGLAGRTAHQQRLMYLTGLWLSRKKALKLLETRRVEGRSLLVLQQAWDGQPLELAEELIPDAELPPLLEELGGLFHLNGRELGAGDGEKT